MKSFPENEPRRYLIAIGSPYCPNMGLSALMRVASDVEEVTRILTSESQGYQRVLSDQIRLGTTAQNIKTALSNWFGSGERQPSDCVVVYWAGHGDGGGSFDHHYLFTVDSDEQDLTSTAVKTSDLIECFFPGSARRTYPQNILLILDTCYAGAGRAKISGALADLKSKKDGGSGLWIISSADANSVAGDGAFVEALQAVMSPDHPIFQGNSDFIPIESLGDAINQYLDNKGDGQKADWDSSGGRERTQFIRNARLINLANRIPNSDRLQALLNQIEPERLYEAYRRCYPGWASQEPFPNPNNLLSVLIALPNGKEKLLPALIDGLRRDQSIADSLRESLQEWGSIDRQLEEPIQPAVQTEFCLMVYVYETKRRYHYAVSAALIEGIDPGKKTDECHFTPLKRPENEEEALTEKQISEQISKVVAGLVVDIYDREVPLKRLSVQCFLPKNFLNIPIEQEVIERIESSPVIGTVCKTVLFRFSERQAKRQKPEGTDRLLTVQRPFVDGNWRERWSTLRSNLSANCRDILVLHQGDDDQFYEELEADTMVGCGFVGFLDSLENEKLFGTIIVQGIPVAIWLRPDHSSEDPSAALASILTNSTIEELPHSLTKKRKIARRNASSDQNNMAQHVALLWDNPLHSFPSIDYSKT
jgi:vWA-MoxR associated protein C-terminal domain/Caspase domain